MDPDPLVRGADPRIRIRIKMSRIPKHCWFQCELRSDDTPIFLNRDPETDPGLTITLKLILHNYPDRIQVLHFINFSKISVLPNTKSEATLLCSNNGC
jgi:hypothetical protein